MATTSIPTRFPEAPFWFLMVSGCWIVGLLGSYFLQPVEGIPRWELFADEFLQLNPAPAVASAASTPSGLQYLPQRFSLLGQSAMILALAACYGTLCLFLLGRAIRWMWSEWIAVCLGTGLSVQALVTLALGLLGQLHLAALVVPALLSALLAAGIAMRHGLRSHHSASVTAELPPGRTPLAVLLPVLAVIAAFGCYLMLGAMTPSVDFDVREYHLQGPKEWFQQGRITFLRHNVYTSFPFQSEMLSLTGMVLVGDWWRGALVGQCVLATYQLLSMLCVYAVARRWIGSGVAWLASLLYLTTPWTLRISLIAYAEGSLSFAIVASTLLAVRISLKESEDSPGRLILLCGLLAGGGMASKYTGLVSAVIPAATILLFSVAVRFRKNSALDGIRSWFQPLVKPFILYAVGVAAITGPWLLRNLVDTGNPVYPLGYSVFGGAEWTDAMNARWTPAHAPAEHVFLNIFRKHFPDVATRNDWTSGLLFAFSVPVCLFFAGRNQMLTVLAGLLCWNFGTWWALTHRIDRFWVPAIPLLSIAAAAVWQLSRNSGWRWFVGAVTGVATLFHLWFCSTALVGFHAGLMDLTAVRQLVIRSDLRTMNETLTGASCVLMIGEAEVFDTMFRLRYNTVFDDCLFEQWTSSPDDNGLPVKERRLAPVEKILQRCRDEGVTHFYVNWNEILRYRSPGNYGYTEYVQPSRFEQLVKAGVLLPPKNMQFRNWADLSEQERGVVKSWDQYESLLVDERLFVTSQLYEVKTESTGR